MTGLYAEAVASLPNMLHAVLKAVDESLCTRVTAGGN